MHDWTLVSVSFDWQEAKVKLVLHSCLSENVELLAEKVVQLVVPRREEWGRSSSVNATTGPVRQPDGNDLLRIEMQSGDVIEIIAGAFVLPL